MNINNNINPLMQMLMLPSMRPNIPAGTASTSAPALYESDSYTTTLRDLQDIAAPQGYKLQPTGKGIREILKPACVYIGIRDMFGGKKEQEQNLV